MMGSPGGPPPPEYERMARGKGYLPPPGSEGYYPPPEAHIGVCIFWGKKW